MNNDYCQKVSVTRVKNGIVSGHCIGIYLNKSSTGLKRFKANAFIKELQPALGRDVHKLYLCTRTVGIHCERVEYKAAMLPEE